MNKQKEKKLVPKLRFLEFQDAEEWSQEKLKVLANRITQKNKKGKITRVLTNSAAVGIIDQRDFFDKDIANKANLEGYFIVDEGDYVYNPRVSKIAPVGPISKNKIGKGIMSPLYIVFRFKNIHNDFYEQYFKTTHWYDCLRMLSNTGARHDRMSITPNAFDGIPLPSPHPKEQQKIADCLSSIDDLISAHSQKLDSLNAYKKGLLQQLFPAEGETVPKLRFPEFRNDEEWGQEKLSKLISTVTPPKKLLTSNYLSEGKFPIVDQSQNYISGWTNDRDALVTNNLPLIIFGDHTCVLKIIYKPFAQGADGIKVLCPSDLIDPRYLYQFLTFNPVSTEEYKRHFSSLKEKMIYFPKKVSGEQQKIADCLSYVDDLLNAQSQKLESLREHKRGLMQGLFPVINENS
ncbi:MAG: restriction endonuclease subunit S [Candidatus Omnitrophica bacterium]|nr:restriction endonuclease subunit S [Candidatus Omnitrophota bacterium]